MANEKILRDNYIYTEPHPHDRAFTVPQIRAIYEMAKNNVYPDGRFGDEECNLWSLMREAVRFSA